MAGIDKRILVHYNEFVKCYILHVTNLDEFLIY